MPRHRTAVAAQPQPQKPQLHEPALPAEPPDAPAGGGALAFASAFALAFALAFAFAASFAPTSMIKSRAHARVPSDAGAFFLHCALRG